MMGTLAAMLARKKIPTPAERYHADVHGDIENVDGNLKITRIHVRYALKLAPDQRAEAQEAFKVYLPFCPAANSVMGAIDISHELLMENI
jgi:organic hydroperoxide reductase OsmC/OhrA